MKQFSMRDEYHFNLRFHFNTSTFLIGKHDLTPGEEITLCSAKTGDGVRVKVIKADKRDWPIFSEAEAEELAGKDPLYMTWLICRWHPIEDLDKGITYIEHTRPELERASRRWPSRAIEEPRFA
ncbi:MAG: hypothetical protein ABSD74_17125 [Rhizomicrobium sp.]|jgi:hypothetical protein